MTQDRDKNNYMDHKKTGPVLFLEDDDDNAHLPTSESGEEQIAARLAKLETINQALIRRVERSMDQRANSYALFQSAILLEEQVQARTTELRLALDELETSNRDLSIAKEQAEHSNSSKTKFLAAASHDLLQPLSAARLNMSTLKGAEVSPQAAMLISQIDRSLMTIEELLRTLFDISKLDARVSVPEIGRFPAERIIRGLHADFSAVATQAGLKLKIFAQPVIVDTDPIFLRRILQNLVSNALRYTDKGGVLIGCRRRDEMLDFEVWDTGCGIVETEHDRIFDEFHRCRNDVHRDGLGLGLAIVKRMAEATGHQISFSSVVGRGSVFRVSVPISKVQNSVRDEPRPAPVAVPKLFKIRDAFIVLIEDDPDVLAAMHRLFTHWGAQCVTADSLSTVMERLDHVERVPDIIVADYNLADEDVGPAVVTAIRERYKDEGGADIPSVIVSATPSPEVMGDVNNAHCEFMTKPVEPAELRALLVHLLNR